MNVTLSIDARILAEARNIAARRGTSLNQLIRDYLEELAGAGDMESVVEELDALWDASSSRSKGPWTRDALHDRS